MAIIEITPAQADQHVKQRWATHRTCNGNCFAGRPCDCTAAVEDAEISQFGAFNAAGAIACFYAAVALVAGCAAFVVWVRS